MTNLTLKDKRIILELDHNSRQSYKQIGKTIGLSKEATRLRIQKLEKKVIEGYFPLINFGALGYSLYIIYLKTSGMSKEEENKFITRINKTKNIGLNVSVLGSWNFNIAIWAKNNSEFEKALQNITRGFEKHIIKKTIMIETFAHYFKFKLFKEIKNETPTLITSSLNKEKKIDAIDKQILISLSKNAKISLTELSKKIGLTPSAISLRIKNLEKEKIILGYKPQLNLDLLHLKIFLKLQKTDEKKEKKIITYLSQIPEVISVSKTHGDFNLEFRLNIKNILELNEIINDFKEKFSEEFIDFEMMIFVKFHKVLNYFPE